MGVPVVTREQIADGLARLGLAAGDVLFFHSSLSRFGRVEGGADAVVDAMLDVLGPGGTLAGPAFSFQLKDGGDPLLDLRTQPSGVGAISEALRRRPGAGRSPHLTHSVSAVGPRADELTGEHSITPCGPESPFAKLLEWDARIAFFGVDQNANTCLHAVEEAVSIARVGYRDVPGARIRGFDGVVREAPTRVHASHPPYDFNYADRPLFDCRAMTVTAIGGAIVRLVRGRAMRDWAVEALRRDPTALTIRGEKWIPRPVRAEQLDAF